jgi:hypothetical protein
MLLMLNVAIFILRGVDVDWLELTQVQLVLNKRKDLPERHWFSSRR